MSDTGDAEKKRPPSVRDLMGPSGTDRPVSVRDGTDSGRDEPVEIEVPSASLSRGDEKWIVRVVGRAVARAGSRSGTPLLLLTFARESDPDVRVYEVLRVGRRLDALSETELLEALESATPYDADWGPLDLFAGTRRQKGG